MKVVQKVHVRVFNVIQTDIHRHINTVAYMYCETSIVATVDEHRQLSQFNASLAAR